jgi:hypothetical protein
MLDPKFQIRPIAMSVALAFCQSSMAQSNVPVELPAIEVRGTSVGDYGVTNATSATKSSTPIHQ